MKAIAPNTTPESLFDPPSPPEERLEGKDELNLAEFPITILADRVPKGQTKLTFCDTIREPKTGREVQRQLTITGTPEYGLPTAKDDEVILGLLLITKLRNSRFEGQRTVHFSRHELIHMLRWPDTGQSYRRLEQALYRWLGVTLKYEKAWWDNRARSWVDVSFHILDAIRLYDREQRPQDASQGTLPFSSFTWNEIIFQSFQANYLKGLDLDFYLRLTTATAKRMFRFLDKRFHHRPRWEFDLHDFAFEHIGLSRDYHTGKIKEKLTPAIAELEALGFLEPLTPADRYLQLQRGRWKVIFLKKAKEIADKSRSATQRRLEKELFERGVTAGVAAELVAAHPAERVAVKIDVFDWLTEHKDKRLAANPAGYLVQSIRDDYAAPKSFTPKAERERLRKEAEEKRLQKEEDARREESEKAAARQARRDHIDAYLSHRPPAERAALEQQALARATDFHRDILRRAGPMAEAVRQGLVDDEVLRRCPLPPPGPDARPG